MRILPQINPARAKGKIRIHELSAKHQALYEEQKIDGERFIVHTHCPSEGFLHAATSRHVSVVTNVLTEKTDRVPHITNHPQLPEASQFDTEFVSSGDIVLIDFPGKFWDKLIEPDHPHSQWLRSKYGGALPVYPHVSNTSSIMGSLGPEAIRKQEERGKIWAYCFDLLMYKDRSAVYMEQFERRKALAKILESVDPEIGLILMPAWKDLTIDEIIEFFYLVTDVRGEGLILKSLNQCYNGANNWFKLKRDYPADVVVTGKYKVGEEGKTGQMLGLASSLEIGVYDQNGILIPIGWISAIMDGMHNLVKPEMVETVYKGRVLECRHNGVQKNRNVETLYTLRHPRFRRWREDKNAKDCTLQNLLTENEKS